MTNEDFYQKQIRKADKTNVEEFFKRKMIEVNKNADTSIKKLSKLYSLIYENKNDGSFDYFLTPRNNKSML